MEQVAGTTSADRLRGVFAPVVTPFDDDAVRLDWLAENLEKLSGTALAGFLALGTNGESKSLTEGEQVDIVKTFARHKGSKVLMVGTGCESTRQTIDWTNQAADLGADYASIIVPHYFAARMTDDVLIGFFEAVANAARIPVLMYNIPKCTAGVALSRKTVQTLSKHDRIAGMKDSGGASIFGFLGAVRDGFAVLAGSANYFLPSLLLGAQGGVISLANCFPEPCCELYEAAVCGDHDRARQLHARILAANAAVSGGHGVAGVKAAMDAAGYHGGAPRAPLADMTAQGRKILAARLGELEFLR